ncbi:MAG: DUF4398 domain-containing protein [Treponema sp.]|jgi:hypothetical protein|nr:DUF4398 domain-containing protein [Treponema sp.]
MMKTFKTKLICGLIAVALVLGACAKPPTEEMNNAAAAVTRAENDADAVTYAGSTLSRARDALSRMQTEADSKRYDAAKTYAAEAIAAADKAIADGRSGAARARDEAAALVDSLRPAIAETEQTIRSAQTRGNVQVDFTAVNQDFDAARRTADQAAISLAGNNYQDALDKGRSARAGLSDINARLTSAATAASRKK